MYSGPWKVQVAKAYVCDEAPLLWTEDSLAVDMLSESWRRSRSGSTEFVRPRSNSVLARREVRAIADWVRRHTK